MLQKAAFVYNSSLFSENKFRKNIPSKPTFFKIQYLGKYLTNVKKDSTIKIS